MEVTAESPGFRVCHGLIANVENEKDKEGNQNVHNIKSGARASVPRSLAKVLALEKLGDEQESFASWLSY